MASQRPQEDVQLYITNPDGTQTLLGAMQSATITQASEPIIPLEEAIEAIEAIEVQATPLPAAMEEEPKELSDLEKLIASFSTIQEGNLYSDEVNRAIEIIAGASTIQEALRQMEQNRHMDFKNLLFRQIDNEGRELDKFMYELQKIPSLPSMDVDYI